jgi:hypothetical protein
VPQQKGRRVVRRLSMWRVAKPGKTGTTFAAFAISVVIVGALISEPGILARTPNGSLEDPSIAAAGLKAGGHSEVPEGGLGLSDGLMAALGRVTGLGPAVTDSLPFTVGWYPPFGITATVGADSSDGPDLPMLTAVGEPSGRSVSKPAKPKPANPKPATKPATKLATTVTAWSVAPTVTWYGPGFYGGRTACGQAYSRYVVGVASRTLACGTLVQFRWHGITVVAPVIDRGPFGSADLVFDFSAALACDLFREHGAKNGCFTRHDVQWRVVGKRRR